MSQAENQPLPEYACPDCGCVDDLEVVVQTYAKLRQSADGNIETEIVGDHDWDEESTMLCAHCGKSGPAYTFMNED